MPSELAEYGMSPGNRYLRGQWPFEQGAVWPHA